MVIVIKDLCSSLCLNSVTTMELYGPEDDEYQALVAESTPVLVSRISSFMGFVDNKKKKILNKTLKKYLLLTLLL